MRRALVSRLEEALLQPGERAIRTGPALPGLLGASRNSGPRRIAEPGLRVLVRSIEQLSASIDAGARRLYADFADIRQYGEATAIAKDRGAALFLATPRIQKPAEMGVFQALARHEADGILVRNLGGLTFFHEQGAFTIADFSLNAANPLTVSELLSLGADEVTASYDLNREQLLELVAAAPAAPLEIVVHQHMPMFHMEHCVFCSVLSPGTNSTNCGRPCDRHIVRLRDRIGYEHLLTADVGCRNTLFNATPQSAAEAVAELIAAGARAFRIELLDEPPDEIRAIVGLYSELLAGRASGGSVWRKLRAANRVGVTRGTLEERRNPLAIL
jgi:putative protease